MKRTLQSNKPPAGGGEPGSCIDDDVLYRYLDGLLSKRRKREVEAHLNSCITCFDEMSALLLAVHAPSSAEETAELSRMTTLPPEQEVAQILDFVEQERLNTDNGEFGFLKALRKKTRNIFVDLWLPRGWLLRPAMACAVTVICILAIGRPIYDRWRSNELAESGLSDLAGKYTITSRDGLRPSGGFRYDEFGATRSGENISNYEPARSSFEKSINLNHENSSAHHSLGTYFLLVEKDLKQAKEHYDAALAGDSTNAGTINDLGVLAFLAGSPDEAIEKFRLALLHNPQLLEARYNLATVYQNQGKQDEAQQEWAKYVELDPTSDWADVARSRMELLQ